MLEYGDVSLAKSTRLKEKREKRKSLAKKDKKIFKERVSAKQAHFFREMNLVKTQI